MSNLQTYLNALYFISYVQTIAIAKSTPLYTYDRLWEEFFDLLSFHQFSKDAVDTDDLNSILTIGVLLLLKKHKPLFRGLELSHPSLHEVVRRRAPCRWEKYQIDVTSRRDSKVKRLDAVLDMGHNPAAMEALVERTKREFHGKPVR